MIKITIKQLQFEQKYKAAKKALQELIDCDKTIVGARAILNEDRQVILTLDVYAYKQGEENVLRKVYDFIPDFELEERMDE